MSECLGPKYIVIDNYFIFDALKYDLKKIEEVVYDISIRGMNKPA